jgi:mannitol-specific phosphotransferase system IIBC component
MAASIPAAEVDTIIVACEAGMGSSLMCVSALRKKLKAARLNVDVVHKAVRTLPPDAKLVIVHRGLAGAVHNRAPGAVVICFNHFLNDPAFDAVVQALAVGAEVKEVK